MSVGTESLVTVTATINGEPRTFTVPGHRTLLDALRSELGLTGTKSSCTEGECGACTVMLDGHAVNSCLVLAAEVDGHEVLTVEGVSVDGGTDLQQAFLEHGAVQCGFCIPGQVMSAEYLLSRNPDPSVQEIRDAMSGNLCRCASYNRIVEAVRQTATKRVSTRG
ncbi:(2Fe-2S)-binding protein [Isoptericola sp. b441]|uniref:(2Fe-2S)-binding protein n=1 Tax=Actinotalea lenta TaxID=3064654 RepID=A0ABT9DBV5_9CELL|nr:MULTISPECIES: (2Fe-2S)-binding protein [unclassified Isoptericola]MDO8108364.1 (2Fe-2S)-binding protein [Isoptericola sp. b441]MDO8119782.1 (2Fe-2S)-binding protein [Isoptericola sp. b490]